jgi:hypothetical protein
MSASSHLIEGRVVDAAGAPVPMASVYFVEGPVPLPDIAALTGPDGAFRLSVPGAGAYTLGVRGDGYTPAAVAVEVGGARPKAALDVVLVPE